jgi:hypothetical protein
MTYSQQIRFQMNKDILLKLSKNRKVRTIDEYVNQLISEDIDKLTGR